jgi:hypothetical protein
LVPCHQPIATSGLVSTSSAGLNRDARKRDEGFDRWAAACCTRQCILKGRGLMSTEAPSQVLYFYNRHPISHSIILEKLRSARGHLDNISPEEITRHDQDDYGRTPATDELARQAGIGAGSKVADFCAGLGGTVRYLTYKYRAEVTGIELTPVRAQGAQDLIERTGLQNVARVM